MKYAFIAKRMNTYPVDRLCRLLGVKRNGFYRFMTIRQKRSNDNAKRTEMLEWVHKIAKASNDS